MSTRNRHDGAGSRVLHASLECEVRGIDPEKRQATFVASTEKPVMVGPWEPEVLRMKGANLKRYRLNPVLLDTHKRGGLGSVIGRTEIKIEDRKLIATATYAKTAAGEEAWQLVRDGFVRGVSIGYLVNQKKVTRLREGEFDGEGDARVAGPASIANDWELLEVSNVPIPADAEAVRRSFYEEVQRAEPAKKGARRMAEKNGKPIRAKGSSIDFAALVGGAILDGVRAAGTQDDEGDGDADDDHEHARANMTCPECKKSIPVPERSADDDEDGEDDEEPKDKGETEEKKKAKAKALKAGKKGLPEKGTTLRLVPRELLTRDIRAITPRGLERVADQAILEEVTFEVAKKRLLEAQASRYQPTGTPEPAPIDTGGADKTDEEKRGAPLPKEITDDVLVRSLANLTGA